MATEEAPASFLSTRAVALYLTGIASFVGLYLPQPILPIISAEFGVDAAASALVISSTVFGVALASPAIGVLSDRFGRRRILVSGSLLLGFASLACAVAPNFELLLLARFVQGLLLPTLFAVGLAFVSEALPQQTMRTVAGIYIASNVIGGMLGRVSAGVFEDLAGWRYGFVLSAGLYLLLVPLWASQRERKTPQEEGRRLADAFRGTLSHLANRTLLAGLLLGFFLFFAFQSTFSYLPFRLEQPPFLLSSTLIGAIYLTYVSGVFSSASAGWLSSRLGPRAGLFLGLGLAAIGNLMALTSYLTLLITGLLILSFGQFLVQGLAVGYVSTSAPHDRAGANALYLLLYYLGGGLGAYLPGFLFPTFGFGGVVGVSLVALACAMGASYFLVDREG